MHLTTTTQEIAIARTTAKLAESQLAEAQLREGKLKDELGRSAQQSALKAVHIYRVLFGYDCMDTLKSCLRLCQISEQINELPYAKIAYERLIQLTKDKPQFEEIYNQATTGHAHVLELLSKQQADKLPK